MSARLTIGVDASYVARDRRGMGRVIRSILSTWEGRARHRLILLCHPKRYLSGLDSYVEKGWEVCAAEKAPKLDVCWFPWNRVDWDPRCPRVVHIHDVAPFTEFHPATAHLAQDRERLVQAAERADRVLTDSSFSRSEIHHYLEVDWERMEVIPLASDALFSPQSPASSCSDPKLVDRLGGKPFLLFVGNTEPRKNLQGLLEAYSLLSHRPPLVLVCPRPAQTWTDRLRGKTPPLDELAKGLDENLIWLDEVEDDTLAELYRRCRLFVMPSLYEGFGLPLLEAMACGTPVAAARAASLPEVGGEAPFWFNPRDPVDIARVLMEALEGPRDSTASLAQARQFSWEETAGRILEHLEESARIDAHR